MGEVTSRSAALFLFPLALLLVGGTAGVRAQVPSPTPKPPVQAINFSTRMRVQTADNVGIGGFIITGSAP